MRYALCVMCYAKNNQKGFALLGIILAIAIIAALAYGSSFFWQKDPATGQGNLKEIKTDLNKIQEQNDAYNKQKLEQVNDDEAKATSTH